MKDETNYNLKQFNGKDVIVYITHKIYGTHKINCIFNLLKDKDKIGIVVNNHEIYITRGELEEIKCSTSIVEIIGKLQTIKIIIK